MGGLVKGVLGGIGAMFGGGGGSASPPPVPAPVPPPPLLQTPQSDAASQTMAERAAAAGGMASTMITGPQGVTNTASTANKTLLGS